MEMGKPQAQGDSGELGLPERIARVSEDLSLIQGKLSADGSIPEEIIAGFGELQDQYQSLLKAALESGKQAGPAQVDPMAGAKGQPLRA